MTTAAPTRRTQAQRRAASRARLLDAALECLAERGYAGTTFPEILRRAQLSNGAMWRHFRSKEELLVAAALHSVAAVHSLAVPAGIDGLPAEERLDAAVDYFWRNYVSAPAFQALIELLRASRSEPELAQFLASIDQPSGELFFDTLARLIGPELASRPHFRRNARLIGLTFYGVGLTANLRAPGEERRTVEELKEMLRSLFTP